MPPFATANTNTNTNTPSNHSHELLRRLFSLRDGAAHHLHGNVLDGVAPSSTGDNTTGRRWLSSAWLPASIIGGGTAALFKSVLDHPSSTTLTPLSLIYLLLLALQYAFQPKLSKRFIAPQTAKTSLTITEELVKSALAVLGLFYSSGASFRTANPVFDGWTLRESLRVAGIPAALYAVQGTLQYTAYMQLDAVTYNGLSQTKIFTSAMACAILLGQDPTLRQCIALSILLVSTLMFQGTWPWTWPWPWRGDGTESTASVGLAVKVKQERKTQSWWVRGVAPCLGSTLLSGVAGALSQKGLQHAHGALKQGRNAYLYTLEVSAYSALAAFVLSRFRRFLVPFEQTHEDASASTSASASASDSQGTDTTGKKENYSLFRGWSVYTFLPVIFKAMGGLLTALVHKHAGSVSKGFALTLGLVLSTCISDQRIHMHQLIGTMLVMLSSWLHFSTPT